MFDNIEGNRMPGVTFNMPLRGYVGRTGLESPYLDRREKQKGVRALWALTPF